jgi:hypothetical protein
MKYFRRWLRLLMGTTSSTFNSMQKEETDALMDKQDAARNVFLSDLLDQIEVSKADKDLADLKIARDELELTNLLGL